MKRGPDTLASPCLRLGDGHRTITGRSTDDQRTDYGRSVTGDGSVMNATLTPSLPLVYGWGTVIGRSPDDRRTVDG